MINGFSITPFFTKSMISEVASIPLTNGIFTSIITIRKFFEPQLVQSVTKIIKTNILVEFFSSSIHYDPLKTDIDETLIYLSISVKASILTYSSSTIKTFLHLHFL